MGKRDLTKEELKKLVKEGWKFRNRKINGKYYITRRKGKSERGLGRYNEDLWKMIQEIVSDAQTKKGSHLSEIKDLWLEQLPHYHAVIKVVSCLFRDKDGYCSFYEVPDHLGKTEMEQSQRNDLYKIVSIDDKEVRFYKVNMEYCRNCSAFLNKKHLALIKSMLS